jgi:cell wall-associated NlpC family hydrolase
MSGRNGSEEAAARLVERVLSDAAFRARFRHDPEGTARDVGYELDADGLTDAALETLEVRESKSSLAGALMAAAAEGVGLFELIDHAGGGGLGVADAVAAEPHASDQALVLLHDPRIQFDASGIADMRSGRIDPRIVTVLGELAKHHRIGVSSMISDHPVHTVGGSVSNHAYGRAADIATVDGRPVSAGNAAARGLAEELLRLDPSIRPTELGSPWALGDPVAFTDADHQDHIHVAFDDPLRPGRAPPAVTPDDVADPDDSGSAASDGSDGADGSNGAADSDGSNGSDQDSGSDDDASDDGDDTDDDDGSDDGDDTDDDDGSDDGDDADDEDDEDSGDDDSDAGDAGDDEDEDEPDENEVGPDQDDLTDDEVTGDSSDDGSSDSGGDQDDSDDSGDQDDPNDGGDQGDGGDAAPDLGGVDAAYPGDDAPAASLAAWMGAEAQRRGLPPELPVMAALVESGMHNLPGGDADSLGFFQMRASIWNSGAYVGYSSRPQLQLDWFLDHAETVRRQRVAAGLPIDDPKHFGDWIADVERPAAQYRGRYQLRLDDARELLRHAPRGASGADFVDHVDAGAALAAGPRALKAVAEARRYLGTPYRWGGSSPSTGFDCSGLVQWAYAKAGIHLPRTTEEQILASGGRKVDRDHLLPGDLVFFRDASGDVHHVGMSLGGKRFIEAPHTGDDVRISRLDDPYYAQQFAGGRRWDAAVAGDSNEARVMPVVRPHRR